MIRQIEDIDVVHVHRIFPLGIFALLLKYRKKYHYIISEHWTGFRLTKIKPLSWFEQFLSKMIVRNAHLLMQ